MNALLASQEMARKNNENAVVYAAYLRRRRRWLGGKRRIPRSKLARRLDELDPSSRSYDETSWQAAEREAGRCGP